MSATELKTLPKAEDGKEMPKGTWRRIFHDNFVAVRCPECGFQALLDHVVAADGTVTPSMDCPKCEFHEFVRLGGWEAGK